MGNIHFEFINALDKSVEIVKDNSEEPRCVSKEEAEEGGNPSYYSKNNDRTILIRVVGAGA
jgi:hypothetical protein